MLADHAIVAIIVIRVVRALGSLSVVVQVLFAFSSYVDSRIESCAPAHELRPTI